jgi:hypothetical protein
LRRDVGASNELHAPGILSRNCTAKLEICAQADASCRKKFAALAFEIDFYDFRTPTSRSLFVIFFLTSFFFNSIHQLVAVEDHCKFSMKNGRENRNNGNQEEGEKEKETLKKKISTKLIRGRGMRPLSF